MKGLTWWVCSWFCVWLACCVARLADLVPGEMSLGLGDLPVGSRVSGIGRDCMCLVLLEEADSSHRPPLEDCHSSRLVDTSAVMYPHPSDSVSLLTISSFLPHGIMGIQAQAALELTMLSRPISDL